VGPLAVVLGMCSAAFAGMAALARVDPAVASAMDSMTEPRATSGTLVTDLLVRLGRTKQAARSRDVLRRRLEQAGNPWPLEVVLGSKVALAVGALLICLALGFLVPMAALMSLPVGVAAFRCPDFGMARLAKRRQARIAVQVPDLADLLLVTSQSGLTAPVAFRRSAEALQGPLAEELATALRQIDLGIPWRAALDQVVTRIEDPSFRRLVSALARTQRLGASVAPALRTVADDLRSERRTVAEERARRAPVKMLFPLVFLILPAFILLTVGPVVLATIRSLR
jgi:tight adherence protein C